MESIPSAELGAGDQAPSGVSPLVARCGSCLARLLKHSKGRKSLRIGSSDGVARIWELNDTNFHGSGRQRWRILTEQQVHHEALNGWL